jgi:hypothetical protein
VVSDGLTETLCKANLPVTLKFTEY